MQKINTEELKQILLEEMKAIHDFCEENKLTYYLWGGTLLGAIRHKGFIPWDDDMDIAMPRKDYQFFVENFDNERYGVHSCNTNKHYPYAYAKAFDKSTVKYEKIRNKDKFDIGIDVDIFPLDETESETMPYVKKRERLIKLWWYSIIPHQKVKNIKTVALNIVSFFLSFFSNKIVRSINKLSENFEEGKGKYILLSADTNLRKPMLLQKEWYSEKNLVPFEKYEFYSPVDFDSVLKKCYGDYMVPPPKEKQVAHHFFEAFRK